MNYEKPEFKFKLKFSTKTTPGWKRKLTDKELEAIKHLPKKVLIGCMVDPNTVPYESAYTREGYKPFEQLMKDMPVDL